MTMRLGARLAAAAAAVVGLAAGEASAAHCGCTSFSGTADAGVIAAPACGTTVVVGCSAVVLGRAVCSAACSAGGCWEAWAWAPGPA